jgi:hypothetical protein
MEGRIGDGRQGIKNAKDGKGRKEQTGMRRNRNWRQACM